MAQNLFIRKECYFHTVAHFPRYSDSKPNPSGKVAK